MFELRPLVYSLGLNNPPHMYFILWKSRLKKLQLFKQGDVWCTTVKQRVLDFSHLLHSALKLSTECHRPRRCFRPVAFSSQTYHEMQITALQWTAECQLRGLICLQNTTDQATPLLICLRNAKNHAAVLDLWHSADAAMDTFEREMWRKSEIQPPLIYI
jgi:hypothetical protein